ncbi:hypothetical protein [Amycolatopsis sp. cmx-4-68]|uniref:hypothetical protein n=1 Tax=Amycolatopsis sp. cmx-4-68 TaxID=2790938 RepID=UPI003979AB89
MNDIPIYAALLAQPTDLQSVTRLALIESSKLPDLTPGCRQVFAALSVVGLDEGCVTRALLHCDDADLEMLAVEAEAERDKTPRPESEFWDALAWMARKHLAGRK